MWIYRYEKIDRRASCYCTTEFQAGPIFEFTVSLLWKEQHKMKVLYWEGDGFVLLYKRLENGKFVWPRNKDEVMKITDQQFSWLLEGLKIEQPRTIKKSNKRCAI
ncbi:IS66 family insertion sequence element accessory protein TnpB [Holdemanella sp.]|uniref:IS66 family insertion sequence element accessory protein TnpB n=1 Tax=Holdemanella sp. TaxID=1971762 RepID=UPI0030809617